MAGEDHPPLRFGVLCPTRHVESWQVHTVERLLSTPGVAPSRVITYEDRTADQHFARAALSRILQRRSAGACEARKPVHPKRLSRLLGDVPETALSAVATQQLIAGEDLDFLLWLGDLRHAPRLEGHARLGVWGFASVLETAFWAVHDGVPTLDLRLLHRAGDGTVRTLHRGTVKAYGHSYDRTLCGALAALSTFPARACAQLVLRQEENEQPEVFAEPRFRQPDLIAVVRLQIRIALRRVLGGLSARRRLGHWRVGVAKGPIQSFLDPDQRPPVEWLEHPRGHMTADPFPVWNEGRLTVLAEDYEYRARRGRIVALSVGGNGATTERRTVLASAHHLAYPYAFEHGGRHYMVVDATQSRRVVLYECMHHPDTWQPRRTILDGTAASDPTIFQYGGRWWIFYTDHDVGPNAVLCAHYADELHGVWEPHRLNPLKTDVRSSRPGGTPFVWRGQLFRPAQDCSERYGGRIVINRVLRLSPDEFQEEVEALVHPYPERPHGLHTLSSAGDWTLVDGNRETSVRWLRRSAPLAADG